MEFLNPGFLFGLSALAVPVIIHLIQIRRYRKIYFSDIRYLKDLQQESRRRSRLRDLLILLLRMLAVACLVLAFARPYLPADHLLAGSEKAGVVGIYIDNSFSMEGAFGDGSLLDEATNKASGIVASMVPGGRYQILTNDFKGMHQRMMDRDEVIREADAVLPSPVRRTLPEVLVRMTDQADLMNTGSAWLFVLSDFQKAFADAGAILPDTGIRVVLVPIRSDHPGNLHVDSCWFESPVQQVGQAAVIHAWISNSSEEAYEKIPVRLMLNGRQRAVASFDVGRGETADVVLPFTCTEPGFQSGELVITDYPVVFDDRFFFSFHVSETIRVLCVNGREENIYLNSLFSGDSLFLYHNAPEGRLDYSSIPRYSFVVLNGLTTISSGLSQELVRFVENGGSLAVVPPFMMDIAGYNSFLTRMGCGIYDHKDSTATRVDRINLQHPLFSGVFEEIPENIDLPAVSAWYPLRSPIRSGSVTLLEMTGGTPFLTLSPSGKGKVYLFAVPFDISHSMFPRHAIFVPALYKMAISSQIPGKLYYTIGKDDIIEIPGAVTTGEELLVVRDQSGMMEFIPDQRKTGRDMTLLMHDNIREAGHYVLFNGSDTVQLLSFNYDRLESVMDFMTDEDLEGMASDDPSGRISILETPEGRFDQGMEEIGTGAGLWIWFIISALVFFFAEIAMLRLLK